MLRRCSNTALSELTLRATRCNSSRSELVVLSRLSRRDARRSPRLSVAFERALSMLSSLATFASTRASISLGVLLGLPPCSFSRACACSAVQRRATARPRGDASRRRSSLRTWRRAVSDPNALLAADDAPSRPSVASSMKSADLSKSASDSSAAIVPDGGNERVSSADLSPVAAAPIAGGVW